MQLFRATLKGAVLKKQLSTMSMQKEQATMRTLEPVRYQPIAVIRVSLAKS